MDSWCKPLRKSNGEYIYGGAARGRRIAAAGGMDQIIKDVATWALERATQAASVEPANDRKPHRTTSRDRRLSGRA